MLPWSYEHNDGLTTCLECGVQWSGDTPLGRCPTCEEAWSAYRRASQQPTKETPYATPAQR